MKEMLIKMIVRFTLSMLGHLCYLTYLPTPIHPPIHRSMLIVVIKLSRIIYKLGEFSLVDFIFRLPSSDSILYLHLLQQLR